MTENVKWEMVSGPGVEVGGTSRSEFGSKTTKVHRHMSKKKGFQYKVGQKIKYIFANISCLDAQKLNRI